MAKPENLLMKNKFRGCLLGALIGDCLGASFEGDYSVSKVVLQQYFDKLGSSQVKSQLYSYTDDTAMTKCLAYSLITRGDFDPRDVAEKFVVEYFKNPGRGYGGNVIDVFEKLRDQKCKDPFLPAKEQFNGTGSYGNGGAMRVSPVALFYHDNYDELVQKAKLSAQITHTHKSGVDGTVLQAIAIYQGLQANPDQILDVKEFCRELLEKMAIVEKGDNKESDGLWPYHTQLHLMQDLLAKGNDAFDADVREALGTSVAAQYSVPTAIYCFLRAQKSIPDIETENPFQRTIQYAVSLGGDTDTIASMAGAIAGAYYGSSVINENFIRHSESSDEIIKIASELYHVSTSKSSNAVHLVQS